LVFLQAHSAAGNSPYSNVFTIETPPSVPGPVTEIKVVSDLTCVFVAKYPRDHHLLASLITS